MWAVHTCGSAQKRTWKKETSVLGLLAFALVGKGTYAMNLGTLTAVSDRDSWGLPMSSSPGVIPGLQNQVGRLRHPTLQAPQLTARFLGSSV